MDSQAVEPSFSYFSWITVAGILTILYFSFQKDRRMKKYLDKFDGPLSLPIIGSAFWFVRPNYELPDLLFSFQKKYKAVFKVWVANTGYVILNGAAEVEKILSSTTHIEKSTDYSVLHKWLGFGLLTAKPQQWRIRRKQLTPAFHFNILEAFMEVFNEQGNTLVEVLKKNERDGKPFDIYPYVTRCALDIICETAMGKKVHAQQGRPLEYVKAVYGYGEVLVRKVLLPWLQIQLIWKFLGYDKMEKSYLEILHRFTESVIKARKIERAQERVLENQTRDEVVMDELPTKRRKAFLDLLLDQAEAEHNLTDFEIREEVDTFMFEGHDTTAANMGWTILLLSLHPEHQTKIQEELDDIFGDDKTRDITAADISKMKYLELCIKESLRIYPSVPFHLRYLNQDCDLGNDRIIPKGTNVFIATICLHRDPDVFPDPETFNPDRFLPEQCIGRNPYAFVPFSAGPRNCIGQKFALLEEKIVLAKLLMNFNLVSVKKREDVLMLPDIILRPKDGIHVRMTQRI